MRPYQNIVRAHFISPLKSTWFWRLHSRPSCIHHNLNNINEHFSFTLFTSILINQSVHLHFINYENIREFSEVEFRILAKAESSGIGMTQSRNFEGLFPSVFAIMWNSSSTPKLEIKVKLKSTLKDYLLPRLLLVTTQILTTDILEKYILFTYTQVKYFKFHFFQVISAHWILYFTKITHFKAAFV